MRNNIFCNPDAEHEIVMYAPSQFQSACNLDVDYSYIRGGEVSINNTSTYNSLHYGEHNLSEGLLFAGTSAGSGDYLRLAPGSPCINAGTPDAAGLSLLPYDLAENWRIWDGRIDMGCYEYGSEPYVGVGDPVVPELPAFSICNYPNPFTVFTNIKVILPSNLGNDKAGVTSASIDIYNIKGQRIKSIPLDPGKTGEQFSYWDGRDEAGKQCSSGIYILNLKVNGIRELSKKVTLIR